MTHAQKAKALVGSVIFSFFVFLGFLFSDKVGFEAFKEGVILTVISFVVVAVVALFVKVAYDYVERAEQRDINCKNS